MATMNQDPAESQNVGQEEAPKKPFIDLATGYQMLRSRLVSALQRDDYQAAMKAEQGLRSIESAAPVLFDEADNHYYNGRSSAEKAAAVPLSRGAFMDRLEQMGLAKKLDFKNNAAAPQYYIARGSSPDEAIVQARLAQGDSTLSEEDRLKAQLAGTDPVQRAVNKGAFALGGPKYWQNMQPLAASLHANSMLQLADVAASLVPTYGSDEPDYQARQATVETLARFGRTGAAAAASLIQKGMSSIPSPTDDAGKAERSRQFDVIRGKVASLASYETQDGGQGFTSMVQSLLQGAQVQSADEFSVAVDFAKEAAAKALVSRGAVGRGVVYNAPTDTAAQMMSLTGPKGSASKGTQYGWSPSAYAAQSAPSNMRVEMDFWRAKSGLMNGNPEAAKAAIEAKYMADHETYVSDLLQADVQRVRAGGQPTSPLVMLQARYQSWLGAKRGTNPLFNATMADFLKTQGMDESTPLYKAVVLNSDRDQAVQDMVSARQLGMEAGQDVAAGPGLVSGLDRFVSEMAAKGRMAEAPAERADALAAARTAQILGHSLKANLLAKTDAWAGPVGIGEPETRLGRLKAAAGAAVVPAARNIPVVGFMADVGPQLAGIRNYFTAPIDNGPVVDVKTGLTWGQAAVSQDPKVRKLAEDYVRRVIPNSKIDKLFTADGAYKEAAAREKKLTAELGDVQKSLRKEYGWLDAGAKDLPPMPQYGGGGSDSVVDRYRQLRVGGMSEKGAERLVNTEVTDAAKAERARTSQQSRERMAEANRQLSVAKAALYGYSNAVAADPSLTPKKYAKGNAEAMDFISKWQESGMSVEEYSAELEKQVKAPATAPTE